MATKRFDNEDGCKCLLVPPEDDSVNYLGKEEKDLKYWRVCSERPPQGWTAGLGWRWECGLTNRTLLALARFIARFNGYRLVKEPPKV